MYRNARELDKARKAYVTAFLTQRGFRLIAQQSVSKLGASGTTYVPLPTRAKCRVGASKAAKEAQVADQTQPQAMTEIRFEVGTVVTPKDRWDVDGVTYDVTGVYPLEAEALCLVASVVKVG